MELCVRSRQTVIAALLLNAQKIDVFSTNCQNPEKMLRMARSGGMPDLANSEKEGDASPGRSAILLQPFPVDQADCAAAGYHPGRL
jgi:hypothetical protein